MSTGESGSLLADWRVGRRVAAVAKSQSPSDRWDCLLRVRTCFAVGFAYATEGRKMPAKLPVPSVGSECKIEGKCCGCIACVVG